MRQTFSPIALRRVLHVSTLALCGLFFSCTAPQTLEENRESPRSETHVSDDGTSAKIDINKGRSHLESPKVLLIGQTTEIRRSTTGSFINYLGEFGFGTQFEYSFTVVDFEIRPAEDGRSLIWVNRPPAGFRRVERRSDPFDEATRESISTLATNSKSLFTPDKADKTGFLFVSEGTSFVSDDKLKPVPMRANDGLYSAEKEAGVSFDVWRLITDPRSGNFFSRFVNENHKVERRSWDGQISRCVSGWSSFVDQGGVFRVYCFSETGPELIGSEEFVYADGEIVHYARQSIRYKFE